ncbi:MAG: gliding motility-associated C-terminal domain-containing protein, partial [Cyclobacteriaceae bacterium]
RAGQDKTITLPTNSLNIEGDGQDEDGQVKSYWWNKVSGPNANLKNNDKKTLEVSGMVQGQYVFELVVTDDKGAKGNDRMKVTVKPEPKANKAPVARAGQDKTITLPTNSLTIQGSGQDEDGQIKEYWWRKKSGPQARLSNQDKATLQVSNMNQGQYVFELIVTDDKGAKGADLVSVTVKPEPQAANKRPVANAGQDKTITLPTNSLTIQGSGQDADGQVVTYQWNKVSGPQANLQQRDKPTLQVNNLVQGQYVFELTVTDDKGAKGQDRVAVLVKPKAQAANKAPIANAGQDKTIILPTNSLNIQGGGQDTDGQVVAYQWTKVSGPYANLQQRDKPTLQVNGLVQGRYVFELTVTDDKGAKDLDRVAVLVKPKAPAVNRKPVVTAGRDQIIPADTERFILSAFASDPDGQVVAYEWEQVAGPAVNMTNHYTPRLHLLNMNEGSYAFRVQVTDDKGAKAHDVVKVTVTGVVLVTAPVVFAGEDMMLEGPQEYIILKGKASPGENGAAIASHEWTQSEGNLVSMSFAGTSAAELRNVPPGEYVFSLTVTDANGNEASDEIRIVVEGNLDGTRGLSGTFNLFDNLNDLAGARLAILDISGKVVKSWDNYQNDWDGRASSIAIPEGTYFFMVVTKDKKHSGTVKIDND